MTNPLDANALSNPVARLAPEPLGDGVEQRFRRVALILSTSVWTWVQAAELGIVDGYVLLALSGTYRPIDAIETSARSRLPLDSVHPALNRLTGRGYACEEHRLHRLTDSGRQLVADFDRAEQAGMDAYLAQAGPDDLLRLESALGSGMARHS